VTLALYGIPNCDTVKKARVWLEGRGLAYAFHDYKKLGVREDQLAGWCAALGWERLLNRAGTTFKALPDADKRDLDAAKAIRLMQAQPSMIKRPLLEHPGGVLIGFKAEDWLQVLG
jgi:arsenate reductase (glutaredoxin)